MDTEKPFAVKLIAGLAWLQIGATLLLIGWMESVWMGVDHASVMDAYEAGKARGQMIGTISFPFLLLPALALLGIRQRRMWLLRLATGFGAFGLLGQGNPLLVLPAAMFMASFASSTHWYFVSARLAPYPQV
jgi:hypothetical protein